MTFTVSLEVSNFLNEDSARPRLVRHRGEWRRYDAGRYVEISEEEIRAGIRRAQGENLSQALKASSVSNFIDEIKAATLVNSHREAPFWIEDAPGLPRPADVIVFSNGMLDTATFQPYAHDDRFFTYTALPYPYDPNAPQPSRWLLFMSEVFGNDLESIGELQKLFGLMLTLDTSLQKIFSIIGPKRSGKSTIARVLRALIGQENVCAPSFHGLGGDFGLQSLIGKAAAIIADARTGHRTDKILTAERLLNISGEDTIDVARKGTTAWTGKLNARVLILSNELPALPDPSGALAGRHVCWETPHSFYGREDPQLTDKLLQEMPGIVNWALVGLHRLRQEGRIVTPASARHLVEEIEKMGSPVKHFVSECCTLGDFSVAKDVLWQTYRIWHSSNGLPGAPLSKEMFGRALKTAYPGVVRDYRPRVNDERVTCWSGIALTGTLTTAQPINYIDPAVAFGQGSVTVRSG